MIDDSLLIEKLAALEHEQWMHLATFLLSNEDISPERREKWEPKMIPYTQLSESGKEQDRFWARKALAIIKGDSK